MSSSNCYCLVYVFLRYLPVVGHCPLGWQTFRRAVHTLMVLSTQRFFEWKAVAHCSRRFADRLTKVLSCPGRHLFCRNAHGCCHTLLHGRIIVFAVVGRYTLQNMFDLCRVGGRSRTNAGSVGNSRCTRLGGEHGAAISGRKGLLYPRQHTPRSKQYSIIVQCGFHGDPNSYEDLTVKKKNFF